MNKISVSILGVDNKIEALKKLNKTDVDYIHVDVMDGKFVPFKTPPFNEGGKILSNTSKKLEVHLMTENPTKYINDYAMLNTEYITIHSEIKDLTKHINSIKEYGLKCGLALSPNTEVETIIPYLKDVNLVLIMSVEPGLPGQTFKEETLEKVIQLKELCKTNSYNIEIAIDGGINEENIKQCHALNIDIICVGMFITSSENYQHQIKKLRD